MHVDFLGSEPFNAASETEAAVDAGKGAKPVAQKGPRAATGGETIVVMRFAVVNQNANPRALLKSVIEVTGNLPSRVILE